MKKIFVIFVFSMGTILSCSKIPEMKVEIDRESFEKEYTAWEAQHIENYVFTFDYMSSDIGPNGPTTISVQNNVIFSINCTTNQASLPQESDN